MIKPSDIILTMLTKFAVSNYRGFKEKIELDLTKHANYEFNTFAIKDGIIKNGIIFGPNGCGKSNLGLAIFDIEYHLSQKHKKLDYFSNYVYAGSLDRVVDFEYGFKFGNNDVDYYYSKSENGTLQSEKLIVNGEIWIDTASDTVVNTQLFKLNKSTISALRENNNNVSIVSFLLSSHPLSKDNVLIQLNEFVNSMLWFRSLERNEFIGIDTKIIRLDEHIISNGYLEDFRNFIEIVSGQKFEMVASEDEKTIFCKYGDCFVEMDEIVSTGTCSLKLLYYWLTKMQEASFVFVDEFDAFYHFRLAMDICRKLFALEAQVFLSSHNTSLITNELLRPDCYFIIADGEIKPLNECTEKELRFGHNLEKMFRGGTFVI